MPDPVTVIQATLAPMFLIGGASIFLNFTQTRLFRVVDRLRAQATAPEAGGTVRLLERRAYVLRNAIASGVATVALTVLTAIVVMLGEMAERPPVTAVAPILFAAAMLSLFVAMSLVLYDTVLSVRSVTAPRG